MDKKRLVVFGDSWARGSELAPNEKTFGELLSERLGCESFANYSHPASSISHLMVQLKNFLKMLQDTGRDPSEYLAVFFLTAQDRSMSYLDNDWIFQTPHGGFSTNGYQRELVASINDMYWKYFHSQELTETTVNTNLVALQTVCQKYNIADFYIPGWEQFDLWPEIDSTRIHTVSCGEAINFDLGPFENNPYIHPNISHPNQLGHQKIADLLYDWIITHA